MKDKSTDELAKILWNYNKLDHTIEKADVIIVLGSHDTRVAKRGAELYLEGYAPYILFSGGYGRLTDNNWTQPEAEIFADIALKMGVPKDKVIIENKSTNSEENLRFSVKLLNEKGINLTKVILVHKPYMERRQYATWIKLFPEVKAFITSPQMSFEKYVAEASITKEETISIIVGDTQRIKFYPARGYIATQDIPNEVWQAYEQLVERGYTSQLVKE